MPRIHFTVDDLSRVRLVTTVGPRLESVFALEQLVRTCRGPFSTWRQRVHNDLGVRAVAVKRLARLISSGPDLMMLNTLDTGCGAPPIAGLHHAEISGLVHEFCQVAIGPHWASVRGYLEVEQAARGRILATGGVELLLTTLHPQVRWEPPVLVVPGEFPGDVWLDGRGLVLVPSLFLAARAGVFLDADRFGGRPSFVFSSPPDAAAAAALWGAQDSRDQALVSLVGRTRAAVLHALTDSCTTGELARRLGISASSASQHASVLRDAGLVTTRRSRSTSLHTLTSLGFGLLCRRYELAPVPVLVPAR